MNIGGFSTKSTILRLIKTQSQTTITRQTSRYMSHNYSLTKTKQPKRACNDFREFRTKSRECSQPSPLLITTVAHPTTSYLRSGFVGWYLGMIKSWPVVTKSVTSCLIYIAADITSQSIAGPALQHYDLVRTLRMGGYGLLILGPSLPFWFNLMSTFFPKRDLFSIFTKIFIGQTVYGPLMLAVFFSLNAQLQGESNTEIIARLKRDLLPTLKSGLMYWPLCDFITFRFIPIHLQPLVSNSFSYLWTIYLTYMANLETVAATAD